MRKLIALFLLFFGLFITYSSSNQVKPLLIPDRSKDQITPLPIEEPTIKKVYGKGLGNIYEGNVENARKSALRMAYADAVSQGSGIEIGSISIIKNSKYVSDIVLSRTRGFIRNFKILNEGIADKANTKYEIFIEAEVVEKGQSPEIQIDGLRLYLEILGNPRLLIILPENRIAPGSSGLNEAKKDKLNVEFEDKETKLKVTKESASRKNEAAGATVQRDAGDTFRSGEAALAQAFTQYGYQVMTSDDLIADHICSQEDLDKAKAGVTAKITEIARAANIDLALFGVMNVTTEITKPTADIALAKVVAEASAKAVNVSSGKLIYPFHHSVQVANFSELKAYSDCMNKAADNIASVLAWKIPQVLTDDYRETRLILSPIDLKRAEEVRNALKGVTGVEDVRFARLPTERNPKAELVLLSGFISIEPGDILGQCEKTLNELLTIRKANKFEIECEVKSR
jgi:hypothetical protein